MPVLDSALLQSTLRDELRAAWRKLHAEHGHDQLYGFGVYTTDSASYLGVTAFSEKGLEARVAQSVADFGVGGRHADLRAFALENGGTPDDPAFQRQSLRWSPCDSPLHEFGSGLLPRSDKIVRDIDFEGRWSGDGELDDEAYEADEDLSDPEVDEVFQVIRQVLKELDREAVFGTGAERERLVLSIWQGDQSNVSRYAFAKALNPPAVVARFGREMNDGAHAYDRLYHGPDAEREDDVFE
jgi:hypothetical protein